jgi:hypothetical protein|tara:strand:+ start:3569 stop:4561 length:993 start_codon:yes stop_codon:yes gene_type:complete
MASPNSTFTEIVSTTLREHNREFADNVSNNNALLQRLMTKGRIDVIDGGYEIVEPLDYAENSTYQRYSGYDSLNVSVSDVLSAAKYDWKQAAVHISASGLELRNNSGENQLIALAKSRITNAIRTFKNNISSDVYSDGTTANQIGGLQSIVSDAGTGTVGGINSSSFTFWLSNSQKADDPIQGGGAVTISKSTMTSLMQPLWLELSRGNDKVDLIVASNDYYTFYWNGLSDLQRYESNHTKAVDGFESLKFVTADVVFDGGTSFGGGIASSHMYFLNTDYLKLVVHSDANMTEVAEQRAINQDAVVIPIIWQGNMVCSNRKLQGVITASG